MAKTILKIYENGDIETFGVELVEADNLFVIADSTPGMINELGVLDDTPTLGSRVSDFIPVVAGEAVTFQLYWSEEAVMPTPRQVQYSVQAYDANFNHVVSITYRDLGWYASKDSFSGTIPANVSYLRIGFNHIDTGHGRIQVVRGLKEKPYTLSAKDLKVRGLPFYSISEQQLIVPKLVRYNPDTEMPPWVQNTPYPVSIFPEGLVIKGELIGLDEPPLTIDRTTVYLKDDYLVSLYNNALHLSTDGGETFIKSLPIGSEVGTIKYVHVFSDGSLMFCSHTKGYYSSDFETYSESTILETNGSILSLTGVDNFSAYNHDRNRQIVDGLEMLTWGNYTHTGAVPIRVWYTKDKGQTIKAMYRFNQPQTNAATHVHNVVFNPADNSFWIQTGDYFPPEVKPQSHFMKCMYNANNDTWAIDTIGSSLPFKSTNMVFVGDYAYWTWDTTGGGVVRCKYDEIADVSKHQQLFQTANDCLDLIVSDRGEFIVTQSYYGGSEDARYVWYSPDGVTFTKVFTHPDVPWSKQTCYYGIRGPNSDGKVMAGVANADFGSVADWNLTPSVFLDELIREAGFPNAFKPL